MPRMTAALPTTANARLARALPLLLVAAACLFNAVAYLAEFTVAAPDINDDVFHFGLIQRMNAAWDAGGNPLDTWIGYWGQGFPVLRYYQHLPHFVVVLVYRLLGETVPLATVYDAWRWLLLAAMPFTFYLGSRRLGAAPITAACVALCTPLLGANPAEHHFLGFQARSFLWSGGGLYTQLMAIVLFPLALGTVVQAALGQRRLAPAGAWLAATWLTHLVLGYAASLIGALVLLHPQARGQRVWVATRLTAVYAGVAIVAAYLLLPTLLEGRWLSRSAWEPAEYWDSYGAAYVLSALVSGGLLDGPRLPVLTLLAGMGALLALWSLRSRAAAPERGFALVALGIFLLGLLLYFGRPTWGRLLDALPFAGSLPLHRFICAVQFGAVLLAGFALARIASWLSWQRGNPQAAVAVLALLLALAPAIVATVASASQNRAWRLEAAQANAAVAGPLARAFAGFRLRDEETPGRGYAGTSWDWGRDFRYGGSNVYHRWSGQDLPAISYMYHTMGLNSDLEPAFDPRRRDHYELFNVRHLLGDQPGRLPTFAVQEAIAPGLVAGHVATEAYFGVVRSVAFYRYERGGAADLKALAREFVDSNWHGAGCFIRIGWRDGDAAAPGEVTLPSEASLPPVPQDGSQPPRGTILSSSGSGDSYQARLRLDEPGVILFRMSYHPNWRARLDGEPVETLMLSPGYIGVRAPAGEHELEMTYQPPRWTRALLWAGLAFLALAAIIETALRRRG